ncbi:MAG: hypothetical protein H8D23_07005 [Candidatus Brocadiales bacterium]|nr:hypothetical protein [Candidatus Brocadiales bacterium]
MGPFTRKKSELETSLSELFAAQELLMTEIQKDLSLDILNYVRSISVSWEEIMNWPPSNKFALFGEFIDSFKRISDSSTQKGWWGKYQKFDDAFNRVNSAVGIETSAKIVIERDIRPFFEATKDHDYFKTLVFLSKFYKIVKFNFMGIFL